MKIQYLIFLMFTSFCALGCFPEIDQNDPNLEHNDIRNFKYLRFSMKFQAKVNLTIFQNNEESETENFNPWAIYVGNTESADINFEGDFPLSWTEDDDLFIFSTNIYMTAFDNSGLEQIRNGLITGEMSKDGNMIERIKVSMVDSVVTSNYINTQYTFAEIIDIEFWSYMDGNLDNIFPVYECTGPIVKNHILSFGGYKSHEDFLNNSWQLQEVIDFDFENQTTSPFISISFFKFKHGQW